MKIKKSKFVAITQIGWLFLALIGVIFAVGAIKGLNLIYLIAAFMISFMFVSSFLPLIGLYNLSIDRLLPSNIFAQKPFPVEILLANRKKRFASYSIVVFDMFEGRELPRRYVIKIPPQTAISASYEHIIQHRGIYTFHGSKITTSYPFDFFIRGFTQRKEEKTVVYPKIVKLNPNFLADLMSEIQLHLNRPGAGTEVYGFRIYDPGDDIRNINWKITAKTSEVTVTKFSQEQNLHIAIVFDNSISIDLPAQENHDKEKPFHELEWFESAVTFVASILSFFIEKGYKVKLVTQSGETSFGEGAKHLFQALHQLAVIQPVRESDITKGIYHPSHLEQKLGILVTCEKKQIPAGHFIHTFYARGISKL